MELNEINTYDFPSGTVDSGKVVLGGTNNNWGGAMERALEIASIARSCPGYRGISSQKRSRVKTASGNVSDHWEGNLSAYAIDIPVRGAAGDELLKCIMSKFDGGSHSSYKGGRWLNVNIDGYRYQFGWRVKNHYDHIHVGVKKKGGAIAKPGDTKPSVDISKFNEKSKENLNKLFDELKKRNVSDPKSAIKNWIGKEEDQKDLSFKSFKDILNMDIFKQISKIFTEEETSRIDEEIVRIKKIMK